MHEILLKIGYFERRLSKSQKALTKLTLFFFRTQSLFNAQDYEKRKGSGTSDQSPSRLQNKLRKTDVLFNQV